MDEFEIASANRDRIIIRHKTEGHEMTYTFHIDPSGRRVLRRESFNEGSGLHDPLWMVEPAGIFVKREAERLDLFSL